MRKIKKTNWLFSLIISFFIIVVLYLLRSRIDEEYQWYYVLMSTNFIYLAFKVYTSFLYRPWKADKVKYSITALIPCFNEELSSIEQAIQSLLEQSVLVDEIIFIDDGSETLDCYNYVKEYRNDQIKLTVHRFDENKGKKEAIKWGIAHAEGDLLLMLDSDGELSGNAVEELVKPFEEEKVGTVCGRVMVRNYKTNFLTRMQEIVYFNAFEVGRASQSIFKDVVVASGALSMHRKKIFDDEALKVFDKKRFFGIRCVAGDDRLLTDISKEHHYHTVYQNTAICYTDVPTHLNKYFKQQVRWLKSAYLQSLYSIRHTWKKPLLFMYQVLESYLWFANLLIIIYKAFTKGVHVTSMMLVVGIIFAVLVSLFNSIKFRQYGWYLYAISIVYSYCYGFLIFIMRIYALLTIWKTGWNTR